MRFAFLTVGCASLVLAAFGLLLPLLPTVPFLILAAFCFARSNPEWERRLLEHQRFGHHIRNWRTHGAISMKGKLFAVLALAVSASTGHLTLPSPWSAVPVLVAVLCGSWILTRPTA